MNREDNAIETGTPKRVPLVDIDESTLRASQLAQLLKPDIKGSVERLVKDKQMSRVMIDIMPEIATDIQKFCDTNKISKEKFLSEVTLQTMANMGFGELLTKDFRDSKRKAVILAKIKSMKGKQKFPKDWVDQQIVNSKTMVDIYEAIKTHLT